MTLDDPTPLQIVASGIFHEACDNADDPDCVSMVLMDDQTAIITSYNSTCQISCQVGGHQLNPINIKITYGGGTGDVELTIWRADNQDIFTMIADLLYTDAT